MLSRCSSSPLRFRPCSSICLYSFIDSPTCVRIGAAEHLYHLAGDRQAQSDTLLVLPVGQTCEGIEDALAVGLAHAASRVAYIYNKVLSRRNSHFHLHAAPVRIFHGVADEITHDLLHAERIAQPSEEAAFAFNDLKHLFPLTVNEPFLCPKNSDAATSLGMAPQSRAKNGLSLRLLSS